MLKKLLAFLCVVANTHPARALDMTVAVDPAENLAYVHLRGPIEAGDEIKFREIMLQHVRKGTTIFSVNIFSVGGNVAAAMAIGDQIRTLQTRTTGPYMEAKIRNNRVVETGKTSCTFWQANEYGVMPKIHTGKRWCDCVSACFLVWASGAVREGGRMGIHRLFWEGSEFGQLPPADARERYKMAQDHFTSYLKKLDVPQTIIDRLFATDSRSMYYLTWPEMELMQSTPYVEEMTYSRCGKSKKESMSAKNNWTMTEDPVHVECYRSILKQILADGARDYLAKYGP